MKVHTHRVRVRYAETDQFGVLHHAQHFVYFEEARTEYLRALGFSYRGLEEGGVHMLVAETGCKYIRPARYDDVLTIETWVEGLRPTRLDFRYRITREAEEKPLALGHTVLACTDADGRPRKVPAEVADAVEVCGGPE